MPFVSVDIILFEIRYCTDSIFIMDTKLGCKKNTSLKELETSLGLKFCHVQIVISFETAAALIVEY